MPKLYWQVKPAATGPYRSFQHRGWPAAYTDRKFNTIMFNLSCADDYAPWRVREGKHEPLRVAVALPTNGLGFEWRRLKGSFATLAEAKAAAQKFYDERHERLKRPASDKQLGVDAALDR